MDLHLNQEKSLLFIPLDGNALLNTIPNEIPVSRIGFELLGRPIGSQVFCEESLIRKIKRVRRCLEHLPDLEDAQMEMALLRSCLYLPKLVYCLCTCSLTDVQAATMAFDKLMRASLESIIGGSLPDWSWLKASLPSSTGGLSLRGAFLHAPAVFNLSYHQTLPMVEKCKGSNLVFQVTCLTCVPPWPKQLVDQTGYPCRILMFDVPLYQQARDLHLY